MQSRQTTGVVLQALLMAVWRRKPKDKVLIHSDQGSQFTSMEWASFLRHRRSNCHDNAVPLLQERVPWRRQRNNDEPRHFIRMRLELEFPALERTRTADPVA